MAVPASRDTGDGDTRVELLADVAEMYYIDGRDQSDIAERVGLSRSNVSRLLAEARRRGIVEFRISRPLAREMAIENELCARFGLQAARVLVSAPGLTTTEALRRVGILGAELLLERLPGEEMLGISWGESLQAVVTALHPASSYPIDVVQLLGGAWISPELSGDHLGRQLALKLGGTFSPMHAPATIVFPALAQDLLRQPGVADVVEKGRRARLAIVGIGTHKAGSTHALLAAAGLTGRAELREVERAGAAGVICGQMYTGDGEPCELSFNNRIAAIDLESVRRMPTVIGVARGIEKTDAIVGALRGHYVNMLATDEMTALAVLKAADSR